MLHARWLTVPSVLLALLGVTPPARAAFHPLEEIPVESPVYRMVEDLAASEGYGAAFLHTRPWNRAELRRYLDALERDRPGAAADPLAVRLRRELAPSGGAGGWEAAVHARDETTALELSPYGRADYREDRARGGVIRDFRAGAQGSLALGEGALFFGDVYAGTTSPGAHGNPADSRHFGLLEGVQVNSYFDRGTLALANRYGRLAIGHTWLRWGPGAWGTMALSDAAPAFDLIEARVPVLRRALLEWFVASLDPVAETYLAGHRLEVRPADRWDVAFAELARFDGGANAPLYLVPVIPYSHVEKRVIKSGDLPSDSLVSRNKNNVMWTLDADWRAGPGLRLYGELAVDDVSISSEKRPRALAWQAGFGARRFLAGRAWTLRGEYARAYQFTYSVWHHHDFAFAGLPTGFELGPDAERVNARLECRPSPAWALGAEGSLTRKGEGRLGEYYVPRSGSVDNTAFAGTVARDARGALGVDWSPAPGVTAGLTAGWARVTARDHVPGAAATGAFGASHLTLRW